MTKDPQITSKLEVAAAPPAIEDQMLAKIQAQEEAAAEALVEAHTRWEALTAVHAALVKARKDMEKLIAQGKQ